MPEDQTQWHREVLPAGWERAAEDLAARGALTDFYLAGGTGLALRIGHRRSADFDLFTQNEFAPGVLRDRLAGLAGLRIRQIVSGTIHLELQNTLVSFLHYPYPLLFSLQRFETLAVADSRDIACMKLNAIAGRGSRRDFVDLYMAARSYGLPEILGWFDTKHRAAPYNRVHLLKAVTYFADAELEPMPNMLVPLDWSAVTSFFTREATRLI